MDNGTAHELTVAIVDGNSGRISAIVRTLTGLYQVKPYGTTNEAFQGIAANRPDVLVVDQAVPPTGGRNLIEKLRERPATADLPIIYTVDPENMVSKQRNDSLSADTVLIRPYGRSAFVSAITTLMTKGIEKSWQNLPELQRAALMGTSRTFNNLSACFSNGAPLPYQEISSSCQPLVEAVGNRDFKGILEGVRGHDNYSYAHSMRVATLLSLLAHTAGFKATDQLMLASGGLLHDAGKMSIPHEVLNKPGRLDPQERLVMQSHVTATMTLLNGAERIPSGVKIIAEQHHEKIDGTGYPHGLKGPQLNELARMAAIVDIFCALTDRRVYKPPMSAEHALKIMTDEMATHIDQHVLKMFRHILLDLLIET